MRGLALFAAGFVLAGAIGAGVVFRITRPATVMRAIQLDGSVPEPYISAHLAILEREKRGPVDLLFLGDSITHGWRDVPWIFDEAFGKNACNAGVISDRTQNVRWRVEHGELDGISPRVIVLQIGINNLGLDHEPPVAVAQEISGLAVDIHANCPTAKVVVLSVFPPFGEHAEAVKQTNNRLRGMLDLPNVSFAEVGGSLSPADCPDGVHPSPDGYRKIAKELQTIITRSAPPHP